MNIAKRFENILEQILTEKEINKIGRSTVKLWSVFAIIRPQDEKGKTKNPHQIKGRLP